MQRLFNLINRNLNQKRPHSLPIITISREKGSGGRPIAYLLAKKLGKPWHVYHKDIVEEIAEESSVETSVIKQLDESKVSIVQELLKSLFGKKLITMSEYYKYLLHVLATIGMKGHAIIIGRGANFLFPHALKVRIVSQMNKRVPALSKYEHISLKEAQKRIKKSDEEKHEFIKTLFQQDQEDPRHYDITIQTGDLIHIEEAVEIIVSLAKKKFKM